MLNDNYVLIKMSLLLCFIRNLLLVYLYVHLWLVYTYHTFYKMYCKNIIFLFLWAFVYSILLPHNASIKNKYAGVLHFIKYLINRNSVHLWSVSATSCRQFDNTFTRWHYWISIIRSVWQCFYFINLKKIRTTFHLVFIGFGCMQHQT